MSRDRRLLYVLVFVVGMASLGAEIAAARLMAPYFGASTIVWANTIAVVLVALSAGYWLGGRLGDRHPHMRGPVPAGRRGGGPARARARSSPARSSRSRWTRLDEISAGAFVGSLFGVLLSWRSRCVLLGAVLAVGDPARAPDVEDSGAHGRTPVRDLDGGLAGRDLSGRAAAHPVRRHAADVPHLRADARRWSQPPGSAGATSRSPAAVAALIAIPVGDRQGEDRTRETG